eukprot:CAMPEP_0113962754 /NCGR_PEP_ID=MMETSP0011_2-20120614/6114_1 /TAXON_ID=101924 /ORGANISM="Rhodosorus marinus" /LENGTH=730 /DNA_ID=CAMNT_0000974689 /DNA_START=226 /DNA_END=2418 /DNA_ORIENTATION=- /assembly_acc=CAM_ASM_000156
MNSLFGKKSKREKGQSRQSAFPAALTQLFQPTTSGSSADDSGKRNLVQGSFHQDVQEEVDGNQRPRVSLDAPRRPRVSLDQDERGFSTVRNRLKGKAEKLKNIVTDTDGFGLTRKAGSARGEAVQLDETDFAAHGEKASSYSQIPMISPVPSGPWKNSNKMIFSAPTSLPNSSVASDADPRSLPLSAEVPTSQYVDVPAELAPFDDENRDYIVQRGKLFNSRYVLGELLGQGSFGKVVKAYDIIRQQYVALKIIRSGSPYYEQSLHEVQICTHLNGRKGSRKAHIMQTFDEFVYRGHQCLVFEVLSYSLYDLLQSADFCGVSLKLVREFAVQILETLDFLAELPQSVIHGDLKPENVLLQHAQRSDVRVVDFGSSAFHANNLKLYIQSRFYRAPEVIIGFVPYDGSIDMWSLGCMLLELHAGYPVFPGQSEGEQIALIVEKLGMPPDDMLDAGTKTALFFEKYEGETWRLKPGLSSKPVEVVPNAVSLTRFLEEMSAGIEDKRRESSTEDLRMFLDLLHRMLEYAPGKRIKPNAALRHPFFSSLKKNTGHDRGMLTVPKGDITITSSRRPSGPASGRYVPIFDLGSTNTPEAMDPTTSNAGSVASGTPSIHPDERKLDDSSGGALGDIVQKLRKSMSVVERPVKQVDESWKEDYGIRAPVWRVHEIVRDTQTQQHVSDAIRSSLFFSSKGPRRPRGGGAKVQSGAVAPRFGNALRKVEVKPYGHGMGTRV